MNSAGLQFVLIMNEHKEARQTRCAADKGHRQNSQDDRKGSKNCRIANFAHGVNLALAQEIIAIFKQTPGVVDVDWYIESDQPKARFVIDKEKAALHGIARKPFPRRSVSPLVVIPWICSMCPTRRRT